MAEQAHATVSKGTREGFVEVSFPTKPDEAVRKELSTVGFRWNGKRMVWWGREELLPTKYKGFWSGVTPQVEEAATATCSRCGKADEHLLPTRNSPDMLCHDCYWGKSVPAPAVVTPQLPPPLPAAAYVAPKPPNAQREAVRKWARKRLQDKPKDGVVYHLTGGKNDKCISNGNTWAESECKPEDKIPVYRLVDFHPLDGYQWKGNAFPPSSGWWSDGTLMLRHGYLSEEDDGAVDWDARGKCALVADKVWKGLVARVTDGRWGTREVSRVQMPDDSINNQMGVVYLLPKDGKDPLVVTRQGWSFLKKYGCDDENNQVRISDPGHPAIVYDGEETPVAVIMPVTADLRDEALRYYHVALEANRPLLQDVPPAEKVPDVPTTRMVLGPPNAAVEAMLAREDADRVAERTALQIVAPQPPAPSNPKILQLRPTPPPPAVPGGELALAKAEANMAEIDKMLAEMALPH